MKKILILILTLFTTVSLFASSKNLIYKETFSASQKNLEIKLLSEDVTIKQIYGDEIIVEVYSNNKRLLPEIKSAKSSLIINSNRKSIKIGEYCNIEISIPEDTKFKNVLISQSSGDIGIEKLYSDNIVLESSSGDLEADSITANYKIDIRKTSGDVEIKNVASDDLIMVSTSGSIDIDKINTIDTSITSTSGSVNVNKLDTESYDLKTTSGSVKISSISADYFTVNSTSGSVTMEFEGAPVATSKITSTSGSVKLYFLSKEGFNIDFSSGSGSYNDGINGIRTSRKTTESFFNGGADIIIKTISGNVSIDD